MFFKVCKCILEPCPDRLSELVTLRERLGLLGTLRVTDAPSSDIVVSVVVRVKRVDQVRVRGEQSPMLSRRESVDICSTVVAFDPSFYHVALAV